MCPAHSSSPATQLFKHSDALDIHNGIMYYYNFKIIRPKTIAHRNEVIGGSGTKNIY